MTEHNGHGYLVEIIDTLEEYYSRYPHYICAEDIAVYPQLDPSIPTGQLIMGRLTQLPSKDVF